MSSPQEMWEALPPVTRSWLGLSVLSTAMVSFGTVSVGKLAFFPPALMENLEVWRLLTNFLFFGKFSFNFLIQMFILGRFSANMESNFFSTPHGGTADYVYALILMGSLSLVIAWFMDLYFMGSSLVFAVLYLWSKRNPEAPTSVWGFRIKGAQLPWAFIAFNVLIGQSPIMDLIGVFIGHVYYYLVEVLPRVNGTTLVSTPEWLARLVGNLTGQAYTPPAGQAQNPRMHNWGGGGRALGQN